MDCSKLIGALKVLDMYSFKGYQNSKREFQELINILLESIHEIEHNLNEDSDKYFRTRLKLCLLQLQYTINRMSEVLTNRTYLKKADILKLQVKKITFCMNEVINIFNTKSMEPEVKGEVNYHLLMNSVMTALKSSEEISDINDLVDHLLCSSLTIAKLSVTEDFNEISASCKNVLSAFSSLKDESKTCENDFNTSYLSYQVNILERKVNTAMLRLFLHVMCYPQESLKKLVKRCGSCKSEKYSEDIDDEISEFDLTCDRIGLVGNFAMMSCEQETVKLKVQNCLANLEFCEESLVPACVSFYLEPTHDKREFLKYLSNEWKSEVFLLNNLLNSIVDPAAFSLVVFEDLTDFIQSIKHTDSNVDETLFQKFYQRCRKLKENISQSPDCVSDQFLSDLTSSLELEIKVNEEKVLNSDSTSSFYHLEVLLSLVDQISEHLNKILNNCSSLTGSESLSQSSLKDITNDASESFCSSQQQLDIASGKVSKEWDTSYQEICIGSNNKLLLSCYLEKANKNSPFAFTLYQKTPVKRKIRDNVALSLDVTKYLGKSFEA